MRKHLTPAWAAFILALTLTISGCPASSPAQPHAAAVAARTTRTPAATHTAMPSATPSATGTVTPTPTLTQTATLTASPTASWTPTATATCTRTATHTPTSTATPTATPDPYAGLTIADLTARTYGGGELTIEEVLEVTDAFTRTLISYPSDGLRVSGFMNEPAGEGPFPVVLVLHGYVTPSRYRVQTYTTRYADALARAGYLAIHPNYRNYAPSDEGPNPLRVGFAVDVLNLIALIQEGGETLRRARPDSIGLFGHSMGGGLAQRVITVNSDVRAAVLYGSMSGDEKRNFERVIIISGGLRGNEEAGIPKADLRLISPIYFQDRITAAVSIHHGENDDQVPPEWSVELCRQLEESGHTVECFFYPDQPHTFQGEGDQLLIARSIEFFNRHLGL